MIHIYRRSASAGARALTHALNGHRWRGGRGRVTAGDHVVCWGEAAPPVPEGCQVLNGAPLRNKLEDALILRAAGVPTIEAYQQRPTPAIPLDLSAHWAAIEEWSAHVNGLAQERDYAGLEAVTLTPLKAAMIALYNVPVPEPGEWLGRLYAHRGGNDLLSPPASPDYWVRKEDIVREFRVHSFRGESIRAGVKIPRATALEPVHPWIRSWDGGWRISYDGRTTQQRHRLLAASAVSALGLQFGAVDIGERADGTSLVLEVNRAPGLEGGTIEAYALAVQQWINRD